MQRTQHSSDRIQNTKDRLGSCRRLPVSFVFSAIVLSSTNERNAFPTRFITSMNTGFDGDTVTSSMRRNCRNTPHNAEAHCQWDPQLVHK